MKFYFFCFLVTSKEVSRGAGVDARHVEHVLSSASKQQTSASFLFFFFFSNTPHPHRSITFLIPLTMEHKGREPTLVEYAQFYGVASVEDPLRLVNHNSLMRSILDAEAELQAKTESWLCGQQSSIEQGIRKENLTIDKDAVQFLAGSTRTEPRIDFAALTTTFYDNKSLRKLEVPLLTMEAESQSMAASHSRNRNDTVPHDLLEIYAPTDSDSRHLDKFLNDVFHEAGPISEDAQFETMECSKDSFLLLQHVTRCEHGKDLDRIAESDFSLHSLEVSTMSE